MSTLRAMMQHLTHAITGMLVVVLVAGSCALIQPKKAEALDIVFDPTNLAKNAISAAESLVQTGILQSLNLKDLTFDGIAWSLAKKVLAQTTRSVIDWINSGFNGKPAFITNYDDYFLEAADQVATEFIAGENFDQLCQPLRVPVQIILNLSYRKARDWETESQCTIGDVAGNVNSFLSGDFSQGGWSMWFHMVSRPENNVYGAAALAEARLDNALRNEKEIKKDEALMNDGMLSVKDCSSGKCIIVTPGKVISEYLNFKLTVGDRVLIEADEVNEIIGALFAQLGEQAITGLNGLLGMSYSDDGTTPSYLSQFEQESLSTGFAGGAKFIDDAIRNEQKYASIHEKALDDLEKAADDASCNAGANVLEEILDLADTYADEVDAADSVIEILLLLKDSFEKATDEELQSVVAEEFQRLNDDGLLHTAGATTEKSFEIAEKVPALQDKADKVCN